MYVRFGEDSAKYHKFRKRDWWSFSQYLPIIYHHNMVRPNRKLNLVLDCWVIAFDRHIGNAQLEVVLRPILELGHSIGPFVMDGKIGEKYTSCVRSNKDEYMPEGMHIGKINAPPGFAEEFIGNPAAERENQHKAATYA